MADIVDTVQLDWINVELFESILEKDLNLNKSEFNLEIKSIKPAVGTGENYIAVVTRVHVEVTNKSDKSSDPKLFSFIIKSIGDNQDLEDWVEKEVLFYSDIVPKLIEIDPNANYIPKTYYTSKELKALFKAVVIQDLRPYGYKMLNRLEGLDFEHCKLFYQKLGGYHALTAACYEKNGSFGSRFHQSNYSGSTDSLHSNYIKTMFPDFIKIFSKHDNLKPYLNKVQNWGEKLLDLVQAVTEPNPNAFNVLCHGDSWTNNILYRHDDNNKPIDMVFIDHQLTAVSSPVLDIFYFFVTSPTIEVRDQQFDALIRIYHDSLVENLKKYNYSKKIPTLRELHLEILNSGAIAGFLAMGMMTLCLVASDEGGPVPVALSDTDEGKRIRYNLYNNPRYVNALGSLMKFLDNRGLTEF